MMPGLYRAVTGLATPAVMALLWLRRLRGKEHPTWSNERLGNASLARPSGNVIWFHAASVGEVISIMPVLEKLRETNPTTHILVTTGTVTSAQIVAERCSDGVIHQFAPVDLPQAVGRFLDHWRPDAAVWVESELWPNMVLKTAATGIPMVLINARMSAKAAKSWARLPSLAKVMASAFSVCLAQGDADAERFRELGFVDVKSVGNLKTDAPLLPVDMDVVGQMRTMIGERPVWLALSIHPGEDAIIAIAYQRVRNDHPNALCLVVPRHPPKAPSMLKTFEKAELGVACRSKNQAVESDTNIYIADTMGEVGTMMALATVAYVGKSLVAHGGQNPMEPARHGLAVVFGPNMENFSIIADAMIEANAARQVVDATSLGSAVSELLFNPNDASHAAIAFVDQGDDVLGQTVAVISTMLGEDDACA